MTTLITNTDDTTYKTDIAQVWLKGCEIKPIGKTGYSSEKLPASGPPQGGTGSTAPAIYRLRDASNKVIDQFLSMASLKAFMKRNNIITVKAKKETIKEAYNRGYQHGYAGGRVGGMWFRGSEDVHEEERDA